MNRKLCWIVLAGMAGSLSGASAALVSEDFESQLVGDPPSGASVVRPSSNSSILFTKVVDSSVNTAGTGNGVQFHDYDPSAGLALEYNFGADANSQLSAVRADFSFSCLDSSGPGKKALYIGLGEFNGGWSLNQNARRFIDCRLYNDGTIDFRSESGPKKYNVDISTGSHELSIFANDYDTKQVAYDGLDGGTYVLDANSVDYWLDGSLIHSTLLDLDNVTAGGTVGTTTNNLGKFGFSAGSSETNLNYVVDDIEVTSLEAGEAPPLPDYLLSETFEQGQTVGEQPNGASQFRPADNVSNCYIKVVGESVNTAGTGNGVQMFDNAPATDDPDLTNLEYNFVSGTASHVSAVRVDFAFAALDSYGAGDDYIAVGLGQYNPSRTFHTTANRYIDVRLYNDGTIDFRTSSGTNAPSSEGNALLPGANTLSIFANDYDAQSIDYTGLDSSVYTLPANSVAYWLNGALVTMTNGIEYTVLDLGDATAGGVVSNTTHNLGKFGFNTGTSDTNLNYVIDDILITTNLLLVIDTYAEWLELFPTLGGSTNVVDDPDADGMDNLLEYALGASPVVADADVFQPKYSEDVAGNWLNYVYNRRVAGGLTYQVQADSDLVGSLANVAEEVGAGDIGNGFESVTNRISTATDPAGFMQLKVELSE